MMFQGNSKNSQYTGGLSSFSAFQPYYSSCQTDGFLQGCGPSKTSDTDQWHTSQENDTSH